jgi:hypothetical protein
MQTAPGIVVVPEAATTGSINQRTCTVDTYGNQACTEVLR